MVAASSHPNFGLRLTPSVCPTAPLYGDQKLLGSFFRPGCVKAPRSQLVDREAGRQLETETDGNQAERARHFKWTVWYVRRYMFWQLFP